MIDPRLKSELEKYSKQFDSCITLFKQHFIIQKHVLDLIRRLAREKSDHVAITESQFSRLKSGYHKSEYYNTHNLERYSLVFKYLDPYIETKFHSYYDGVDYVKIEGDDKNVRLQGAYGVYKGYSWDKVTSDRHNGQYIHVFNIHIVNRSEVTCDTLNSHFEGHRMILLGTDRIGIDIGDVHRIRKISLVIQIGKQDLEALKKQPFLKMAYVDSGDKSIRCGMAILERVEEPFHELTNPLSCPFSELKTNFTKEYFNFLLNTQLLL